MCERTPLLSHRTPFDMVYRSDYNPNMITKEESRRNLAIIASLYQVCCKMNELLRTFNYKINETIRYQKFDPKVIAWQTLLKKTKNGSLVRPKKCTRCDSTKNIDGHHPDYSKPDCVIWLCRKCHRNEHVRLRNIEKKSLSILS